MRDNFEYLHISLSARIVLNMLKGVSNRKELSAESLQTSFPWSNLEEGINIIHEVHDILKRLTSKEPATPIFSGIIDQFQSYDQMTLIKEVMEDLKWETWDYDLEHWDTNKENIKKYFRSLESKALHKCNESCCF
jgi:hypothetical protein